MINHLKQISNPYSTGGGGSTFERKVQSVFLLSLLINGFSPVLNEKIKRIDFQGRHLGYNTDDIIITSDGQHGLKLLCQIKSDITISENSSLFQDIVSAAWHDFITPDFKKGKDRILLITGIIAKQSYDALTEINVQANDTPNADVFFQNINTAKFIDDHTRDILSVLKKNITKANDNVLPNENDIWNFCKSFTLLIFDLDYENSVNKMLIHSLIGCNSDRDARDVWCRLESLSAEYNQSGGSVTIDVIPDNIIELFKQPPVILEPVRVADFNSSETMSIIALLGSWDENNINDQAMIAEIYGNTYQIFETQAHELLIANKQFIKYNGGIWRVNNRKQLFDLNTDYFFDKTIIRAFKVCTSLLLQKSKRFTEKNEYSYIIPHGGAYDNSDVMRNGLLKGLCLLINNLSRFQNLTSDTILTQTCIMIRNLFTDCDWTRLASIGELLPFISEMSPSQYIKELEKFITTNPDDIICLFPKKGSNLLFDTGFIHYLIWSIEAIAWIPGCLVQGISCLGEIAEISHASDYVSDKPVLDSITAILLPWHPQTIAPTEKQKNSVKGLLNSTPDVGWSVLMRLMPHGTSTTMGAHKPHYINCDIPEDISVSIETYNDLCSYYTDLAVEFAGTNIERLEALSEFSCYMSENSFLSYLSKIIDLCADKQDNEIYLLWIKLWDVKYRLILDNDKKEPESECYKQLCRTIDLIEPDNIFYKYQKLYLANLNEYILNDDLDWKKEDVDKTDAICEIFRAQGIDVTYDFSVRVNNKYDVGRKIGSKISMVELDDVIIRLNANSIDHDFAISIINSFAYLHGVSSLLTVNLRRFEPKFIASVISGIPLSNELIIGMQSLLKENEDLYWKTAQMPFTFYETADYDLSYVVKKLISVERSATAMNFCGTNKNYIPMNNDLIYEVLKKAATIKDAVAPNQNAACNLIEKLQNDNDVDIERLSEIEFIYLPYLDEFSSVKPRAMYYRISNQPLYFCEIIRLCYKGRQEETVEKKNEKVAHHLFDLVFNFCIIPGTDWEGGFHEDIFASWVAQVVKWSKENDRYEIAMQTIGHGLTYASVNDGLPAKIIMETLNAADANDMRLGYKIEVFNKRGVHFIDPQGAPERELAQMYYTNASKAEQLGYARFAQLFRDIADNFIKETENNKKMNYSEDICE